MKSLNELLECLIIQGAPYFIQNWSKKTKAIFENSHQFDANDQLEIQKLFFVEKDIALFKVYIPNKSITKYFTLYLNESNWVITWSIMAKSSILKKMLHLYIIGTFSIYSDGLSRHAHISIAMLSKKINLISNILGVKRNITLFIMSKKKAIN